MFSDVERSPSWHSPPLAAEFAPHVYSSSSTPSGPSGRPPVQSGWFPLEGTASASSSIDPSRGTNDLYADHAMLPPPAHRPPHHQPPSSPWPPADPYADNRPRGPPVYAGPDAYGPHTPSAYSPLYGYTSTPVHTPNGGGNGGGFGWQDARPFAPPSIHTTGLEHLRMPYDDMHRVHAAAQGMHAMMGGSGSSAPHGMMGFAGRYGSSPLTRKTKHKEISVGRWTSEEHRVFLKGLELYQGPSWGEIARMIGTRTSTQVRTHAQKFFTKLARTNQVLPYFENQIQKERTRLITQGAVPGSSSTATTLSDGSANSSVTPTSTTAHSYAFNNTLSPPRKRGFPSPSGGVHTHNPTAQRPPHSSYDDHNSHGYGHPPSRPSMPPTNGSTPMGGPASMYVVDPAASMDPYKPRLDSPPSELLGLRKPPRLEYATMTSNDHLASYPHAHQQQPSTPYGDHAMMAYTPTSSDAYRDPTVGAYVPPPQPSVHGDWNDAAARAWPPSVEMPHDPTHSHSHASDPDSLPSVTRLLYRGGGPSPP